VGKERVTEINQRLASLFTRFMALLEAVWAPAVARVREEVADMQAIADREGAGIRIAPWDYRYYAEKVRKARYDLDRGALVPFLQLDPLREGMFWVAGQALAADAWEAFTSAGGPHDEEMAKRLRDRIFAVGNTVDPAEAYRSFRGRDAGVEALLRKRGFRSRSPRRSDAGYFQSPRRRRASTTCARWYALWSATRRASRRYVWPPSPCGMTAVRSTAGSSTMATTASRSRRKAASEAFHSRGVGSFAAGQYPSGHFGDFQPGSSV
jgi:Peptidase family M3